MFNLGEYRNFQRKMLPAIVVNLRPKVAALVERGIDVLMYYWPTATAFLIFISFIFGTGYLGQLLMLRP